MIIFTLTNIFKSRLKQHLNQIAEWISAVVFQRLGGWIGNFCRISFCTLCQNLLRIYSTSCTWTSPLFRICYFTSIIATPSVGQSSIIWDIVSSSSLHVVALDTDRVEMLPRAHRPFASNYQTKQVFHSFMIFRDVDMLISDANSAATNDD